MHKPLDTIAMARSPNSVRLWILTSIVVVLAAALLQAYSRLDVDLAWLLTVGEKMAAGKRLYIDIWEVNPPFSVFLYLPAVYLGRLTGLEPEMFVAPMVLVGGVCSVALCVAIVRPTLTDEPARRWRLFAAGVFVLLLFPGGTFGQREHIAVISMLPFVGLAVLRASKYDPPSYAALLSGLGAGIAMCIKPHFALAVGFPLILNCIRQRSLRPALQMESWIAAIVVMTYGTIALLFYRAFLTDILPILKDTYLPDRLPLPLLLFGPAAVCLLVMALAARLLLSSQGTRFRPAAPFAAASMGAVGSYLIQGKMWPYQSYPMLALGLFAILAAADLASRGPAPPPRPAPIQRWTAMALLFVAIDLAMSWFTIKAVIPDGLRDRLAVVAPHPRLLTISGDIGLGHPLVRELRGEWVAKVCSEWITLGVTRLEKHDMLTPAGRARLEHWMQADRRQIASDIMNGRPNVILIDRRGFDWGRWAKSDPGVKAALAPYKLDRSMGEVDIWLRN